MKHSKKDHPLDHHLNLTMISNQDSRNKILGWRKARMLLLRDNSKVMDRVNMPLPEQWRNKGKNRQRNTEMADNRGSHRGSRIINSSRTLGRQRGRVLEDMIMIPDHIIRAYHQGCRRSNNSSSNNGSIISITSIIINIKPRQKSATTWQKLTLWARLPLPRKMMLL